MVVITSNYAVISSIPVAHKLQLLIFFPPLFLFNTLLLGASSCARLSDDKSIREMTKVAKSWGYTTGTTTPVVRTR